MALGRPRAVLVVAGPGAGDLVRAKGFEPLRLSTREPKSRASTSSATPAKGTLAAAPTPGGPDNQHVLAWRQGGAAYITQKAGRAREKWLGELLCDTCLLRPGRPGYEALPIPRTAS